jgi:predicted permease
MPIVGAVVIASLAVGIGVNTAVFSWIEAVVLRPLPGVPDAWSFQSIEPRAETGTYPGMSWLEYQDLRQRLRSVRDLLAFRMVPLNVGEPGHVERAHGQLVSGNYFQALQLRPARGRFIQPDEVTVAGRAAVAVVSYDYWRTHLGARDDAIGTTLRVNGRVLTIVGVAPERFQGTILALQFDMWLPATLAPDLLGGSRELEDRTLRGYSALGRLAPGVSREQAQAELDQAMRELAHAYPETNRTIRGEVLAFWQAPRGPQRMLAGALFLLQGVLLLLLLSVCGNTANLMLARASTRQREVGVRLALGGSRLRIVRLFLTENLLLSLLGAAAGLMIAAWATNAMRAVPFITAFPIKFETTIDGVALAFAGALGVLCGLVFGAAPATQLAGMDPATALRTGSRNASRSTLRYALMAVEVGLAAVVLLAAGLFLRSFRATRDTDPGFRREGVLLAAYDLSARNLDDAAARTFASRLLGRLRSLPSVETAAIATSVPLDIHGLPLRSFTLEGRASSDGAPDRALSNVVSDDYFRVMGIPIRAGTDFVAVEDRNAPPQAIVNEAFVHRFLEQVEPIGRRLENRGRSYTITAVVQNSLSESFGEAPTPVVYFSFRDRPASEAEIHIRTRPGAEMLLGPEVERVVRDLDPTMTVYDIRTLGDHVEKNLFLRRIPARMFVVLGPLLLVLAAVGIYAVVAYTVAQRTTEIGVRMALGATAARIIFQIVAETLRVIAAGVMAGWLLGFVIDLHLVRGAIDLPVFAVVPTMLIAVATVACWLPARRAAMLDPSAALRQE